MLAEPPCKHQGHDHTDGNQEQLSPMSFTYTSCYCEENVYFLISALIDRGAAASADELYAVFVSNPAKQVRPIGAAGLPLARLGLLSSLRGRDMGSLGIGAHNQP